VLRDKRMAGRTDQSPRPVYFDGAGVVKTPVYQRAELVEGRTMAGPVIIEEYASTTVVHPGDEAVLGPAGCLVLTTGS